MRKMTNSAGRTGATPISQMSRPFKMSSRVIVVRSQVTKNASSSVVPIIAPPPPLTAEKQTDRVFDARPQRLVVRLEDHPLGALVNRRLEEYEQPAHADVFPKRIGAQRTRAPQENPAA